MKMCLNRRKRNRNIILPEITLTPLIDTALTLLIIFMVTTPMIKNSLKISLPEVKSTGEKVSTQKRLEIFIDKSENIKINNESIKFSNLAAYVEKKLAQSTDKVVIINGDKEVSYNSIMKILDLINSVKGEKYVALVAKKVA